MTFTYQINDLATNDVTKLRLLINDTVDAGHIFEDEELTAFLAMEGNVALAAARALEVIASNEVLVQKRIKTLELSTDGPAEAEALLKIAKSYRDTWEASNDTGADFEIVSVGVDQFSRQQIWWNEFLDEHGLSLGLI